MTLEETRYVRAALVALAAHMVQAACFCKRDLSTWCPDIGSHRQAPNMTVRQLRQLGFIVPTERLPGLPILAHGGSYYAITDDGVEAAKSAQAETVRQKRNASSFGARLWSLVRMRQAITALEAATLLTDAGDNLDAAVRRAASYLRTWSQVYPEALQTSAKRFDGGFKRYVLLKDLGPGVPDVGVRRLKTKEAAAA